MTAAARHDPARHDRARRGHDPRGRRGGMTLVEMMVSLALLTIILGGSASLVMVAGKALGTAASNDGGDAAAARAAASQIVDDLKVATAVTEQTARAVTMTVPDRTGDGAAETIRYAWGGTPGDPLTRSLNNGPAGIVAANVRALSFSYLSKLVGKPPPAEGPEAVHREHLAASASTVVSTNLSTSLAVAEYIGLPSGMPANAVSWKVGRCRVHLAQQAGSVGTVTAAVHYADPATKKPAGAALQTASTTIATLLAAGGWVDLTFAAPVQLDAGKAACLVFTCQTTTGTGAKIYYDNASADTAVAWMTSSNAGAAWGVPVTSSALQFRAWGTVSTQERETLDFQPLPAALP